MKVHVLLFAALADLVGHSVVEVDVPAPVTADALLAAMRRAFPAAAELLAVSRVAFVRRFCSTTAEIDPTGEIAIIPPVSGG